MSPKYLSAVRESDYLVGRVLKTIGNTGESRDHTLVLVTADHGGAGRDHSDPRRYETSGSRSWSGAPASRPAPTSTT